MIERSAHADKAGHPVRDSLWLSKAEDGDVLVVVEHSGIRKGEMVDVVLQGGRLLLRQPGRVYADLPAGEDHEAFLRSAPNLFVLEVAQGADPEDDRFISHGEARLVVGSRGTA